MNVDLTHDASFQLLRTNPKLTGNVKLIANSSNDIFLEAFDVGSALSKKKYKKYPVSSSGKYEEDLIRFYDNGNLSLKNIFEIENIQLDVKRKFNSQYYTKYWSGGDYAPNYYDENFSYFAPLWLNKNVPDYFIIFRNEDSLTEHIDESNLFEKSTIVKTFSLKEDSSIGKYIRSYSDRLFQYSDALSISFNKNIGATITGIDVTKGGFVNKSEIINSNFISTDGSIINDDEYITLGFERNGLAIGNILNLEFMFNDENAEIFKPYRYFGLYISENELGTFRLDGSAALRDIDNEKNQIPKISSEYDTNETNLSDFIQANIDGIAVYPEYESTPKSQYMSDKPSYLIPNEEDLQFNSVFYLKGKSGDFYNFKNNSDSSFKKIRLAANKINWKDLTGGNEIVLSAHVQQNNINGIARFEFAMKDAPKHGDRFFIARPKRQSYELILSNVSEFDTIRIAYTEKDYIDFAIPPDSGDILGEAYQACIDAWESTPVLEFTKYQVSRQGDKLVILENDFHGEDSDFNVSNLSGGDTSCTLNKLVSSEFKKYVVTAIDHNLISEGELLTLKRGKHLNKFFSNQGTLKEVTNALVDALNEGENLPYKVIIIDKNSHKILATAKSDGERSNSIIFGEYKLNTGDSISLEFQAISQHNIDGYNSWSFIGGSDSPYNKITIDKDLFSAFNEDEKFIRGIRPPSRDNELLQIAYVCSYIDEPIYDTLNNIIDFRDIDTKVTVYTEKNTKIYIDSTESIGLYELYNIPFGALSIFKVKDFDFNFYSTEYSISDELKSELIFYKDIFNNATNNNPDIEYFINNVGFNSVNTVDSNGTIIPAENEYTLFNENAGNNKHKSRINPYITKWSSLSNTDSRLNPHRLNSSIAFSNAGILPITKADERLSFAFTHEWFYLHTMPNWLGAVDLELNDIKNYFDYAIDISEDGLYNSNVNYFEKYFTINTLRKVILDDLANPYSATVTRGEQEVVETQHRYSKVNAHGETIFRGVKFKISNTIPSNGDINETNYNNYKFSAILIPHDGTNYGEDKKRFEIKIIMNKKFKNITFLVFLQLDHFMTDFAVDRTLLYSLDTFYEDLSGTSVGDLQIQGIIDCRAEEISGTDFLNGIVKGSYDDRGMPSRFKEDIKLNEEGVFNSIRIDYLDLIFDVDKVISNGELSCSNFRYISTGEIASQPTTISNSILRESEYVYENGRFKAASGILSNLAIGNVAKLLAENSDFISYETIDENGILSQSQYSVSVIDQTAYSTAFGDLYRYGDKFMPKFNDVIRTSHYRINEFDNAEITENDRNAVIFNAFKNRSTEVFNDIGGALIEGLSYNAVMNNYIPSNGGVLGLIDPVRMKDLNVFDSTWANGYYTQSYSVNKHVLQNDIPNLLEHKAMFGSKMINLIDEFEAEYFIADELTYTELNEVRYIEGGSNIRYAETQTQILLDIDVTKIAINAIYDTFVKNTLSLYLNERDSKEYIFNNLLDKYNVESIQLYSVISTDANLNESLPVVNFLNMNDKLNLGYSINNNYSTEQSIKNKYDVRIIVNKTKGYNYSFSPTIKMIKI